MTNPIVPPMGGGETTQMGGQGPLVSSQKQLLELVNNPPQPPSALQLIPPTPRPNKEAEDAVLRVVKGNLTRMYNFRRNFDANRAKFYKQYVSIRDQQLFPDGKTKRSNTFVPYALSNVETIVSRTLDALFSQDPWFEVKPRGSNDAMAAEALQLVLAQKIRKAGAVDQLEQFIRNVAIYGHGGLKLDWDWGYDSVVTAQPILAQIMNPQTGMPTPAIDPMTGSTIPVGYQPVQKLVPRARPKLTNIDIYDLLIDPDGGYVAHLTEKTFGEMKQEAQMNPELYYPESMQEIQSRISTTDDPDSVIVRMAEFWNELDGTCTLLTFGEDSTALAYKDQRYALRSGGAYSSYKRKLYGGPTILLWHGPNPFMHKRAPILHTSYIKCPNEVFGIGAIECITDLLESLNRQVNMITDNWNLGVNRRYAYDSNADIDHDALNNMNVPGGKVAVVGDPNKVIMPLPQVAPSPGDYELTELYKGMIEMASGVSDFYSKGVGSSGANDTATGINQIINESNFRFKMFIRNLENDVLDPLLEMCTSLIQQYTTDQEEVLLTDNSAAVPKFYSIPPEALLGSFDFELVSANFATNKVVKQRQMMAFSQIAAQSPYLDQYKGLITLGKIMEIPDIKHMLKTPQQVQQEQQAAQQQQMQMMIFETMLQTESAARISQSKPRPTGGGQGTGGGRPRGLMNPEGKPPGAGLTTEIQNFAQSMGLRGMGLDGATGGT